MNFSEFAADTRRNQDSSVAHADANLYDFPACNVRRAARDAGLRRRRFQVALRFLALWRM